MIHRVVPVRSRALAIGCMLFFSNITALAFGPPLIGALSDSLKASYGVDALRYALASASVLSIASAAIYLCAARPYRTDLVVNSDPLGPLTDANAAATDLLEEVEHVLGQPRCRRACPSPSRSTSPSSSPTGRP